MDDARHGEISPHIWLDLATPPQVLFFEPVVEALRAGGASVSTTVRDFGPTVALARAKGFEFDVVGSETGQRPLMKAARTLQRAMSLVWWVSRQKPFDLAIGYNSYAQAVAAKVCGVALSTLMDYEHQPANRWCFRLAKRIIVPEAFDASSCEERVRGRISRHRGLKEHVYLDRLTVDREAVRRELELNPHEPFYLVRMPASFALYHQFDNELVDHLIDEMIANTAHRIVLMPRNGEQLAACRLKYDGNSRLIVAGKPVDGPSLISASNAVFSAGGTMVREAAVLGVPSFSLFKGRMAGVDRWLVDKGRLHHIASLEDLQTIPWSQFDEPRSSGNWFIDSAREDVAALLWKEAGRVMGDRGRGPQR